MLSRSCSREGAGDFCERAKIPIRRELVSLTGSFELAVLLNQIIFSHKDELTLDDVRRLSLTEKTKRTLRKKLDMLVSMGFIEKSRRGSYGGYLYRAGAEIYPRDGAVLALIEGLDLKEYPCYLTACVINKFRQFALSGTQSVHISARRLKELLGAEKSVSLLRLILKRLSGGGYISGELKRGTYSYKLNVSRLTNILDPAAAEKNASDILNIYKACLKFCNLPVPPEKIPGWKLTFKRMIMEGDALSDIKRVLAHVCLKGSSLGSMPSPAAFKKDFAKFSAAAASLSRRKALRFIYKLLHASDFREVKLCKMPAETACASSPSSQNITPKETETASSQEFWDKAQKLVESKSQTFKRWFSIQSAGVTDVELEDYLNEAVIFAYERFSRGLDDDFNMSGIKYKLQDYMYKKRRSDKTPKKEGALGGNTIFRYFDGDISEIIDRIDIPAEDEEERNFFAPAVEKLLGSLDPRTAGIIADYHGLDGRSYTFEEIAAKYQLSSAGYVNRLYHKGMRKLRSQPPPKPSPKARLF